MLIAVLLSVAVIILECAFFAGPANTFEIAIRPGLPALPR